MRFGSPTTTTKRVNLLSRETDSWTSKEDRGLPSRSKRRRRKTPYPSRTTISSIPRREAVLTRRRPLVQTRPRPDMGNKREKMKRIGKRVERGEERGGGLANSASRLKNSTKASSRLNPTSSTKREQTQRSYKSNHTRVESRGRRRAARVRGRRRRRRVRGRTIVPAELLCRQSTNMVNRWSLSTNLSGGIEPKRGEARRTDIARTTLRVALVATTGATRSNLSSSPCPFLRASNNLLTTVRSDLGIARNLRLRPSRLRRPRDGRKSKRTCLRFTAMANTTRHRMHLSNTSRTRMVNSKLVLPSLSHKMNFLDTSRRRFFQPTTLKRYLPQPRRTITLESCRRFHQRSKLHLHLRICRSVALIYPRNRASCCPTSVSDMQRLLVLPEFLFVAEHIWRIADRGNHRTLEQRQIRRNRHSRQKKGDVFAN